MSEVKTFTLEEAQLQFAKTLNGKVWELLQNSEDKGIFLGDFNGGNWHGLR